MSSHPEVFTIGDVVVDWIERHVTHGIGPVQGDPYEVSDEFYKFIIDAYTYTRDASRPLGYRRQYNETMFSRAKGWSKSEGAAAITCAEFLAPVRFNGFSEAGEILVRPVRSPEILCFATDENQTGNTYESVQVMLKHERISGSYAIDVGISRSTLATGGVVMPQSTSVRSADGKKTTFAVRDETHLWTTPQLKLLASTVRRNLGKIAMEDPWSMDTTTMCQPGQSSVAEGMYNKAPLMANVLLDHVEAPLMPGKLAQYSDEEMLAALNVAYGDTAVWQDLTRKAGERFDPEVTDSEIRRYYFNQRVVGESFPFNVDDLDLLIDSKRKVAKGTPITLGFDGSYAHDATVLLGCTGDGFVFVLGWWEKPFTRENEDWLVPTAEVNQAVQDAFERFHVVRMYADPPRWQNYLDRWIEEHGEKVVIKWYTARVKQMASEIERLLEGIRARPKKGEPRAFTWDGDPRLRAHFAQAIWEEAPNGQYRTLRKEHNKSMKHIDGSVGVTLAYAARGDAIAAGDMKPRRKYRTVVA